MNWTEKVEPIIWPWSRYRRHLEAEVEYLKSQLAQRQRQIDVMVAAMVPVHEPKPNPVKVVTNIKPQPRGWDDFRAAQRNQPEEEKKDA